MHLNTLLLTVRSEITAAEDRAALQARAITALLSAGEDSAEAEQALFRQMDDLALLRTRMNAIHVMRDHAIAG